MKHGVIFNPQKNDDCFDKGGLTIKFLVVRFEPRCDIHGPVTHQDGVEAVGTFPEDSWRDSLVIERRMENHHTW